MGSGMTTKLSQSVEMQRRYYEDTAARYNSMHAHEGATDPNILPFVVAFLRLLDIRSVLDVGSGTGLGLRQIKESLPGMFVCGTEPVAALAEQAVQNGHALPLPIVRAAGETLPFPDASFDAVCEFAMLHHVPNPNAVVKEMLRVAKKAVFITDSNRFGQGPLLLRVVKLFLYKMGLWGAFDFLRTHGKRYQVSEGDGIFYSYSVYDSYELVARWADRVFLFPSTPCRSSTWFHPLLSAPSIILIAFRDVPRLKGS